MRDKVHESALDEAQKAILSSVPDGYGMTDDEARIYANKAIDAYLKTTDLVLLPLSPTPIMKTLGWLVMRQSYGNQAKRDICDEIISVALRAATKN
jgi:hypothetical protein